MDSTQEIERLVSAERSRFSQEQSQQKKYAKTFHQLVFFVFVPCVFALCIAMWLLTDVLKELK